MKAALAVFLLAAGYAACLVVYALLVSHLVDGLRHTLLEPSSPTSEAS